jgi:hypothetical protein
MRYSRALILFGSVWAGLAFILSRLSIGSLFGHIRLTFRKIKKRIVIVGSNAEGNRVMSILNQVNIAPTLTGYVNWQSNWEGDNYIGDLLQLAEIIRINRIDEIVFCAKDLPSQEIIRTMLLLGDTPVEFKIAPPESLSVIGSSSINTAGELYVVHLNTLNQSFVKRKKRIFDVTASLLLLLFFPIAVFYVLKPWGYLRNIALVLFKYRSWVGLAPLPDEEDELLPDVRPGILTPVPGNVENFDGKETIKRLNLLYAKDYKIINDISIILREFRNLGK